MSFNCFYAPCLLFRQIPQCTAVGVGIASHFEGANASTVHLTIVVVCKRADNARLSPNPKRDSVGPRLCLITP